MHRRTRGPTLVMLLVRARTWPAQGACVSNSASSTRWPAYAREVEALGGRIMPVITVNGEPQYGFFPTHIEAAFRGERVYE